MLNLQQNRKNALHKIAEMFVNCKQIKVPTKSGDFFRFYPTDLVNTKTKQHRIQQISPSGSVNSARYIPRRFASLYIFITIPFRGIAV